MAVNSFELWHSGRFRCAILKRRRRVLFEHSPSQTMALRSARRINFKWPILTFNGAYQEVSPDDIHLTKDTEPLLLPRIIFNHIYLRRSFSEDREINTEFE